MGNVKEKANITIRYGNADDNELLAELGAQSFYETFAAYNTPENMAAFLAKGYNPQKQAAELTNSASIFLIAELEGVAAGYALLHRDSTEPCITGTKPIELRRIYTLQAWIGRGVGAALMQAAIAEAKARGHDTLWLGVWEKNERALTFYRRWGFVEVGSHLFVVGDDPQTDLLMQLVLA
jgi:GNAT superfamily N-acetyltransferase